MSHGDRLRTFRGEEIPGCVEGIFKGVMMRITNKRKDHRVHVPVLWMNPLFEQAPHLIGEAEAVIKMQGDRSEIQAKIRDEILKLEAITIANKNK